MPSSLKFKKQNFWAYKKNVPFKNKAAVFSPDLKAEKRRTTSRLPLWKYHLKSIIFNLSILNFEHPVSLLSSNSELPSPFSITFQTEMRDRGLLSAATLLLVAFAVLGSGGTVAASDEAYVTLLYGDQFVLGARVLGKSLRDTGTTKDLVALVSDGVSTDAQDLLKVIHQL